MKQLKKVTQLKLKSAAEMPLNTKLLPSVARTKVDEMVQKYRTIHVNSREKLEHDDIDILTIGYRDGLVAMLNALEGNVL